MSELAQGSMFSGHEIIGVAGRGGMGVVYRARQLDLDRIVALKVIAPTLAQDTSFRERFIRESRVAASLDHPNVIPVFAAGESDGVLYLTMRFVAGDDLRTLVRREGPLPGTRAAGIVRQVAAALDAAHERGIVHRDVKPANVLLDAGDHAYLTDFGLTKRMDSAGGETRTGGWVGTLGYVAPEQIRGERVDARTDVYALGCVLFHALTGAAPYRRDSDEATMWAHLNDPPPRVSTVDPGLPAAFDAVLARALAKAPGDRFPSAGDLGRAALAAADGRRELASAPGRIVATGSAAPSSQDDRPTATSAPATRAADPTGGQLDTPATAPAQTRATDRDRRSRLPGRIPRAAAAVVVLGALGGATALLASGGEDPGTPASTSTARTATTPARSARVAGPIIPAGSRPNGVVAGPHRRVWVISYQDERITVIDARTGERTDRFPRVGRGAQSVDAGFDRIWVAKAGTRSLIQIDDRTGLRAGPPPIPLPEGNPVRVRVGEGAVWVGIRSSAPATASLIETVAKVDPTTGAVRAIPVPGGVQDLDVGDGAVWVVGRGRETLTRIDVATGAQRVSSVGRAPRGVAVGGGSVWVANSAEGSVTRISTRSPSRRTHIRVGTAPRGVAYGAGSVWVTNELDDSVSRIDPSTRRVLGAALQGVGSGPSSISARGDSVWVVSPTAGGVTRIVVG